METPDCASQCVQARDVDGRVNQDGSKQTDVLKHQAQRDTGAEHTHQIDKLLRSGGRELCGLEVRNGEQSRRPPKPQEGVELKPRFAQGAHSGRNCSSTLRVLDVVSVPVCSVLFRSMSMT